MMEENGKLGVNLGDFIEVIGRYINSSGEEVILKT